MSHATQGFIWCECNACIITCKALCCVYMLQHEDWLDSFSNAICVDLVVLLAQSAGLSNFAWGHRCSRQDTLSGLAVKYGVTPLAIKMTNNLISDQGLQSRDTIYVPGQHI